MRTPSIRCGLPEGSEGYHALRMREARVRGLAAVAVLAALLACSRMGTAQDKGDWRAASSNANAITGDIEISSVKVTINFMGFAIAEIRKLTADENTAVFDTDLDAGGTGKLYRLRVPAEQKFAHHNTLCGTEVTQWMVTYVEGKTLRVAFFSGGVQPVLTFDALTKSTDVCGIFTYAR